MVMTEEQTRIVPPTGTGAQKEQVVQRMFSSIAHYYDLNNSLLSFGLHYRWKQQAVALVPLGSQHVLDVGSGTGDLALLAARRLGPEARILAADLNHPMLAVGLNKVRDAGLEGRILSVQANADGMCALDSAFDAVTTGFCLRNVGDLPKTLREMHRVLRPGGRLVCLEFSRPVRKGLRRLYDWYSFSLLPFIGAKVSGDTTGVYQYLPASIRSFPDQEGLAQEMRKAGFGIVEYKNLTGGIVAIHVAVK
jgi:demethylmenaquinone methyltransferase / 2-methoxy-6-polyprenyl-1,4-benzoquinol methylase